MRYARHTDIFSGLLLALLLLATLLVAAPVAAQEHRADPPSQTGAASSSGAAPSEGKVSNMVQELSHELYSPFCPGKTIAMCPSGGAAKVRREMQDMARQGMDKPAIKEAILDEYGDEFRFKEPPAQDNIPMIAAVLAGLLICLTAVWYLTRSGDEDDSETTDTSNLSDEEEVYLDEIRDEYME